MDLSESYVHLNLLLDAAGLEAAREPDSTATSAGPFPPVMVYLAPRESYAYHQFNCDELVHDVNCKCADECVHDYA